MAADRAASALRWWQDAGVDTIVGESPRDWLKPETQGSPRGAHATPPRAEENLPDTLEAFHAWLLETHSLPFAAASAPRIGPAGDGSSGLMVLTDMPTAEDFAAGMLISSDGLFDRMLEQTSKKIGRELSRATIYLASLSPLRPPPGNLDPASAARLAEIARHHIALAAPRAVLLLGDICSKALLGGAVAHKRGAWHEIATNGGKVRALVTMKPENLNLRPNLKKHAWADLQMLEEGLKP